MRAQSFTLPILFALAACGDDAGTAATDTTAQSDATDTSIEEDSAAPEDTVTPDTAPDTVIDTASDTAPDTAPDTRPEEVTQQTCGCGSDAVCLQAHDALACITVAATCTGGLERVDACATDDVMASCERTATTQYLYWARIEGWIASAATACDGNGATPPGAFSVATVPAGDGAPCSCQRSASACVETYGELCAALTCEAGVQATTCADANRVPGRCVTRDGQREIVFYGLDAELAETTCLGASATEYYWFPAGF